MPEKRSSSFGLHDASSKKPRLAEAEILSRTAATDTALEVDIMVLDYQAFYTTNALLNTRNDMSADAATTLERHLDLMNSWMAIFKTRHPLYQADYDLRLRLDILRFCTLYIGRFDHGAHTPEVWAIREMRAKNDQRAASWIESVERVPSNKYNETHADIFDEELPIAKPTQRQYCLQSLAMMGRTQYHDADDQDHFYGSSGSIALLDVLPLFMQICANTLAKHNRLINTSTMQLSCDFMRQACLEQYLVYGATGNNAIDVALAWGCYKEEPDRHSEEWAIDYMFRDRTTGRELTIWTKSKELVLEELMGDADKDEPLEQRLGRLARDYPLDELDDSIRECIRNISDVIEAPILVQLERGQLKGLPPQETAAFLEQCGIKPGIFNSSHLH